MVLLNHFGSFVLHILTEYTCISRNGFKFSYEILGNIFYHAGTEKVLGNMYFHMYASFYWA